MQCPKCHHVNQSGSAFCSKCGNVFEAQQPPVGAQPLAEGCIFRVFSGLLKVIVPLVVVVVVVAIWSGGPLQGKSAKSRRQKDKVGITKLQLEEVPLLKWSSKAKLEQAFEDPPEELTEEPIEKLIEAQYVRIEAGSFTMGVSKGEAGPWGVVTQHKVKLTGAFEMSASEVTQGQYEQLMGENPSQFKRISSVINLHDCDKSCPVELVSWHDAVRYCNKLSEQAGLSPCYECSGDTCEAKPGNIYACEGYRLPTEAEWEYAARAGTSTAYYSGEMQGSGNFDEPALDKIGWYFGNRQLRGPQQVKGKVPNAWGLYDMSGNVSEWCHDWYQDGLGKGLVTDPSGPTTGMQRVIRGGSSSSFALDCRSASRRPYAPDHRDSTIGFRPVRSLR